MFRIAKLSTTLRVGRKFSSKILKSTIAQPLLQTSTVDMNFGKFIMKDFTHPSQKDQVAVLDGTTDVGLTFEQLHNHAYTFADHLRKEYNVNKGDSVAIFSPNHINYHTAFQGVSLTGAFNMMINPLYTEEEAGYQVEMTRCKVMIAHPFCMEVAAKVAAKYDIPLINMFAADAVPTLSHLPSMEAMFSNDVSNVDLDAYGHGSGDDLLCVPFSSGTTGRPKGVMLSHKNVISNLLQCMPVEGDYMKTEADGKRHKLLCPLPFFHIYGLVAGLFLPILNGAQSIFMPAFDLVKFLDIIQNQKVDRAHVVPPICVGLAKHPIIDKYDLSSLEVLMSGAAPLGAEVQHAVQNRLNCIVKQAWGMTELSPAGNIFDDNLLKSLNGVSKGSVGPLVPETEGKIIDLETGSDLAYTDEGELCIRGPQVMLGYFENKEATDAMIDKDGWLHTGDIARFDEDGMLYLLDRCKELIKYKGFQVAPAELEALLLTMPDVADCVVIPVLCDDAGEIPRAYVVKAINSTVTEEDICAFVAGKVSPHKKLRGGVKFTDVIPKSASGKILRRIQIQKDRS